MQEKSKPTIWEDDQAASGKTQTEYKAVPIAAGEMHSDTTHWQLLVDKAETNENHVENWNEERNNK